MLACGGWPRLTALGTQLLSEEAWASLLEEDMPRGAELHRPSEASVEQPSPGQPGSYCRCLSEFT